MNFNRDNLVLLGVIVALAACVYLYKENQKQKAEMTTFALKVASQLNRAPVKDESNKPVVVEKVSSSEESEEE